MITNDDVGLAATLTGGVTADLDHSGSHTVGDEVTWTATVTDARAVPAAHDVAFTLWLCPPGGILPPAWTATSWTATRGTAALVTGPDGCPGIRTTIATLATGESATLTVKSALRLVPPVTVPAAIAYSEFSSRDAGDGGSGFVIVN